MTVATITLHGGMSAIGVKNQDLMEKEAMMVDSEEDVVEAAVDEEGIEEDVVAVGSEVEEVETVVEEADLEEDVAVTEEAEVEGKKN